MTTWDQTRVVVVLGNHEMPHIYGVTLSKGPIDFTPRFEHALGRHREQVLAFFESLPLFVRSAAGVLFSHAGPSREAIPHVKALFEFDHRAILDEAELVLSQSRTICRACTSSTRHSTARPTMKWPAATWRSKGPQTRATRTCCAPF